MRTKKATLVMTKVISQTIMTVKRKNCPRKVCLGMKWINRLRKKIGEMQIEDNRKKQCNLKRKEDLAGEDD